MKGVGQSTQKRKAVIFPACVASPAEQRSSRPEASHDPDEQQADGDGGSVDMTS